MALLKLRILVVVFASLALTQMSDAKPGQGGRLSSLEAEVEGLIHERSSLQIIPCNGMLVQKCKQHCIQWKYNICYQSEPDASDFFDCHCSSLRDEGSQTPQRKDNGEKVILESFKEMAIGKDSLECTPINEEKCLDLVCTDPDLVYEYKKRLCIQHGNPGNSNGFVYCECYNY